MLMELRLYRVKPGTRSRWLDFFEQQFLPLHQSVGLGRVLGHFLSYRNDEGFAWLHGFRTHEERERAKDLLWGGEDWQRKLAETAKSLLEETKVHLLAPVEGSRIRDLDDIPVPGPGPGGNRVLEIRIYRIQHGSRDAFAEFFRNEALRPQEALGMNVLGQFFDLEDEDCFVWLRGFSDLETRDRQKAAFYDGDLWLNELEAKAFSMIEDYSNVWLVTPAAASRFQ